MFCIYTVCRARVRALGNGRATACTTFIPPPDFGRGVRVLMLATKVPVAIHSRARDRFVYQSFEWWTCDTFRLSCVTKKGPCASF